MARGCCTFKQSDVTRLLRAAKRAGVDIARIQVKDGTIQIYTGKPIESQPGVNEEDIGL